MRGPPSHGGGEVESGEAPGVRSLVAASPVLSACGGRNGDEVRAVRSLVPPEVFVITFLAALLALSLLLLAGVALARRNGPARLATVPVPARLRRAPRSGRRRGR